MRRLRGIVVGSGTVGFATDYLALSIGHEVTFNDTNVNYYASWRIKAIRALGI